MNYQITDATMSILRKQIYHQRSLCRVVVEPSPGWVEFLWSQHGKGRRAFALADSEYPYPTDQVTLPADITLWGSGQTDLNVGSLLTFGENTEVHGIRFIFDASSPTELLRCTAGGTLLENCVLDFQQGQAYVLHGNGHRSVGNNFLGVAHEVIHHDSGVTIWTGNHFQIDDPSPKDVYFSYWTQGAVALCNGASSRAANAVIDATYWGTGTPNQNVKTGEDYNYWNEVSS